MEPKKVELMVDSVVVLMAVMLDRKTVAMSVVLTAEHSDGREVYMMVVMTADLKE